MLTPNALKQRLTESADALDEYLGMSRRIVLSSAEESSMRGVAQRLAEGLYVLLPPRGPKATADCPHCGNQVTVSLSK